MKEFGMAVVCAFAVLMCMLAGAVIFPSPRNYADTAYIKPSEGGYVVVLKTTGANVEMTDPLPLKDAEGIANDYNVILWDRQLRPSAVRTDKIR